MYLFLITAPVIISVTNSIKFYSRSAEDQSLLYKLKLCLSNKVLAQYNFNWAVATLCQSVDELYKCEYCGAESLS